MLKPLEQRVDDLEDLIADIPHMINLRLENLLSAMHETNTRIALIDRQVGGFVRDIRDLRGGVTRQLIAQDKEIAEIKAKVSGIEGKVSGIEGKVSGIEGKVSGLEAKLDAGFAELLARLPKV